MSMRQTTDRSPVRRRLRRLLAAFGCAAFAAAGLNAMPAQAATVQCQVKYAVQSDWGTGFTTNVTITNLGSAWTSWTLGYAYSGSQTLSNGWSATWSQSGANVTAVNASWDGAVATNGSVTIGAQFTYSGTNTAPTVFSINGTTCAGPHAAPIVSITSPAAGATFVAPASIPLTATASAASGSTITQVQYFSGTTLLGSATAAPYAFTWTGVAAGSYSITAVATDSTGASTTSSPVGVTVSSGPSITVNPTTLTVAQGTTGTFGVSLNAKPSASVTVAVARASGNTGLSVTAGASLTFTTANWNTAQNVTITADASSTGTATFTASATGYSGGSVSVTETGGTSNGVYEQRFLTLYNEITNTANGYFSPQGIPYHSVETLMVEAPDYGHETTSEAWSYLIWLQATYGEVTGNWTPFNNAWSLMEKWMIPSAADQPTASAYNPASPAQYAPEEPLPDQYPVATTSSIPVGQDPLAQELDTTYGTWAIYGMHWLLDTDNKYGYGDTPGGGCEAGPNTGLPSFINSYQRGAQESVWETVPQPTCDNLKYGGPNGYLDLFISGSGTAQWKFTDAPDADARAVQAAYWADTWAKQQGVESQVTATVAKAGKLGDYLRYALFDKYFKQIGNCTSPTSCPGATGRGSEHYLLAWYYAWGGSLSTSGAWGWRIGDGAAAQGYQNPMAAWALVNDPAEAPKSPTAASDWTTSLSRQLQFYQWLQSAEGGIAGGATNSWNGQYGTPPSGDPTFYGMAYDWEPVYHDPPSNNWFGFQAWSMERVAEYYFVTGDATAGTILKNWVTWAESQTTVNTTTGAWQIPSNLTWTGQPNTWNPTSPQPNTNLHVTVASFSQDVGVAAALAKTLLYYAAKAKDTTAQALGKNLLDTMWNNDRDSIGIVTPETRTDYNRFTQVYSTSNANHDGLFIPAGWTGTMPNGDKIVAGDTFLSIRSWYTSDPQWSKVQAYLNGGAAPSFTYHRFWAQADVAMAYAVYGMLFNA